MSNFHPDQSPHFDLSAPPGQFAYPPQQQRMIQSQSSEKAIGSPYFSNNLPYFILTHHSYFPQPTSFPLTQPSTTSLPLVRTSPFPISPSTGIIPALLERFSDSEEKETVNSGTRENEKASTNDTNHSRKRSWSSSTTTLCGAESEGEEEIEIEPVIKRRRRKTFSCKSCRKRKVRCDRKTNCSTCKARGEPCVWGGANGINVPTEGDTSKFDYNSDSTVASSRTTSTSKSSPPPEATTPTSTSDEYVLPPASELYTNLLIQSYLPRSQARRPSLPRPLSYQEVSPTAPPLIPIPTCFDLKYCGRIRRSVSEPTPRTPQISSDLTEMIDPLSLYTFPPPPPTQASTSLSDPTLGSSLNCAQTLFDPPTHDYYHNPFVHNAEAQSNNLLSGIGDITLGNFDDSETTPTLFASDWSASTGGDLIEAEAEVEWYLPSSYDGYLQS